MKNQNRLGSTGNCICPKCGYSKSHQRGIPCQQEKCPVCNVKLIREGSYHHQLLLNKKGNIK